MAPGARSSLNLSCYFSHNAVVAAGGRGRWGGGTDIAISLLFRQAGTFIAPLFMLL